MYKKLILAAVAAGAFAIAGCSSDGTVFMLLLPI